ncbi:hypothetical protein OKN36_08890 [Furfurilactobacillus sp. OKN36]
MFANVQEWRLLYFAINETIEKYWIIFYIMKDELLNQALSNYSGFGLRLGWTITAKVESKPN